MLRARERALKAGTLPRTDSTIEAALVIVRDLARFLTATRNKQDWALTDVHDVEAFLATMPKARQRRLTVLRQYFRFARSRKVVLIDPTRGSAAGPPAPTRTHTRHCSGRSFTRPPAARSGSCAWTTSTLSTAPSAWANVRIRCLWTRPAGRCCSAASRTARTSAPTTPT
ncbi:hypothetical protein ABT169_20555 [Streptomyces sp. NPDC001616]|uniref:hypothetical protein n=1 Tax=Streptomyces sp. NPDC001616 TaxID=3156648 RepID=UPI00332ECE4E